MPRSILLAAIAAPFVLAGCTTMGGNVKGDFACKAPGGTCAPMSTIDGGAVAGLGAGTAGGAPAATTANLDTLMRAGPVPEGSIPARTGDRVLRIVFPARVDGQGIYRDEATAYAVVERGMWTGGSTQSASAAPAPPRATASAAPRAARSTPVNLDDVVAGAAPVPAAAQAPTATLSAVPITAATAYTYPGQAPLPTPERISYSAPSSLREALAAASAPPTPDLDPAPAVATSVDADGNPLVSAAPDPSPAATPQRHRVRWKGRWYWKPGPSPAQAQAERARAAAAAGVAELNARSLAAANGARPTASPASSMVAAQSAALPYRLNAAAPSNRNDASGAPGIQADVGARVSREVRLSELQERRGAASEAGTAAADPLALLRSPSVPASAPLNAEEPK